MQGEKKRGDCGHSKGRVHIAKLYYLGERAGDKNDELRGEWESLRMFAVYTNIL